jgi:hypothetical protein
MMDRDVAHWEDNNAALARLEVARVRGFLEQARDLARRAAVLQSQVDHLDNDFSLFRDTLGDAIGDLSRALATLED